MQTVGSYIRKCREDRGLTLRELGPLLGVSHATVASWEQDKAKPAASYFPAMVAAVGADMATLEVLTLSPEVVALRAEVSDLKARLARVLAVAAGVDGARP